MASPTPTTAPHPAPHQTAPHHKAPGPLARKVMNPLVALAVRRGVDVLGARLLAVRGRTSGQVRTVPVNVLALDGHRYLVAPRGQTQWVRNLRVAGEAELRLGRRAERVVAREVAPDDAVPVLRAYLRRWAFEVGALFDGVSVRSSDAELLAAAARHPVFEVTAA